MPISEERQALIRQVRIPTNDLRNRATLLFESPDQLNQDAFGICGMAAVVYVMLRTNPTAVVDLLGELFGKGRQNLATMTDGDPSAQNQLRRIAGEVYVASDIVMNLAVQLGVVPTN